MPHRVDEEIAFLLAFILALVDVRFLDLISRLFKPMVNYLFGNLPQSTLSNDNLTAFQALMSQLLLFTLDLVVYFVMFLVIISAIRAAM